MEVKANCSCGQHFAFDIDPVDGQMPYAITCPECNADLTPSANEYLASAHGAHAPPEPEAVSPPAEAVPEVAAEPEAEVKPKKKKKKKKKKPAVRSGPNLVFAGIGALVGGLIGMAIWYALARYASINVGWVAWGVGGLVGFGALMGAEGEHSDVVGVMSALIAAGSILLGQYLAIKGSIGDSFNEMFDNDAMYQGQIEFAKRVVGAKDDEELKKILIKEWEETVTDEDVATFKSDEMPRMRELASGKITKEDLAAEMAAEMSEFMSPWVIFKESFGLFTIIFILLGMGTAYKLPSGNTD